MATQKEQEALMNGVENDDYDSDEDESDEDAKSAEEKRKWLKYQVIYFVACVALFAILLGVRSQNKQLEMYPIVAKNSANKTFEAAWTPGAVSKSLDAGLWGSVILAVCVPFLWKATRLKAIVMLPFWMYMFIAAGLALEAKNFAYTCNFGSKATFGCAEKIYMLQRNSSITTGHFHTKPEVAGGILGGCFASFSSVAITVVGLMVGRQRLLLSGKVSGVVAMEAVEKTKFVFSLGAICADLMDWQDFTLTLIDGDVLSGLRKMENQGKAGWAGWNAILAWSVISFLAITGALVYEFTHAFAKIEKAEEAEHIPSTENKDVSSVKKETPPGEITPAEWYSCLVSLLFIELPFLAFRTYTLVQFESMPSGMMLKNLVSVPKEIYELVYSKALSNALTDSMGATDQVENE